MMTRMRKWRVVASHPSKTPNEFEARNIGELQKKIEEFTDEVNKTAPLPFKDLTFRVRGRGPFEQLQVFFVNRHHSRARFMKLEEMDLGTINLHISTAVSESSMLPLIGIGYSFEEATREIDKLIEADIRKVDWMVSTEIREIPYYAPSA